MRRHLKVLLLALLCWPLLLSCSATSTPNAVSGAQVKQKTETVTPFEREIRIILVRHPPYVWGGIDDVKGVDCSGFLYLAAKRAGKGAKRTTSERMSYGLDGWTSDVVLLMEASVPDIPFFSMSTKRPRGHVGVLLRDSNGGPGLAHASSEHGQVVLVPFTKWWSERTVVVRRLK